MNPFPGSLLHKASKATCGNFLQTFPSFQRNIWSAVLDPLPESSLLRIGNIATAPVGNPLKSDKEGLHD